MSDSKIPAALRDAQERISQRIYKRLPGCPLPDCNACRNNKRFADTVVAEAMAAALRWAYDLDLDDLLCLQGIVNAIAALDREATDA